MKKITNAKIICGGKILENHDLYYENGKIFAVNAENLPCDEVFDAKNMYLSAGFIDIHIHGGGGYDFMDCTKDAFFNIAAFHAKHGTTTLIPTTMASRADELYDVIEIYKEVKNAPHIGANFGGLHFEGPYFAKKYKGAQNEKYLKNPDKNEYMKILDAAGGDLLRWSIAPELEGGNEMGKILRERGVLPSVAHSAATYDDVLKAYDCGYTHLTHFYCAMSTVTKNAGYRTAGIVESGYLIDDMTVEIIADGCHLPPALLKTVYKFKGADKTALITDSMRCAGCGEGKSILGSKKNGVECIVEDGVAKLPDRSSFAGSVATADRLVRTVIKNAGVPLADAVKMMTETPAKIMNLKNKGKIEKGYDADFVIFDGDINIAHTVIGGKMI